MPLYDNALQIGKKLNDLTMQANCIGNQGLAQYQLGDFQLAKKLTQEALEIRRNLGDHAGEAVSLNILALIDCSHGQYRQAILQFEQAAGICERLGDKSNYALSLNNLANMQAILGEYDRAQKRTQEALQTALLLNYPLIEISATRTLGVISLRMGNFAAAKESLQAALKKSREVSLGGENAETLTELAEMRFQRKEFNEAREYATLALSEARKATELTEEIKASAFVHAVEALTEDFIDGIKSLREILVNAEKFGDPRIIIHVQRLLGQALTAHGQDGSDTSEGIKILNEAKSRSRELQIAYEEKWIGNILAKSSGEKQ
ncbi:MAG: tetratricopeptide repeat protein [candidate division Zixibacteria bacterium]|nr:tetratricopeptide repeat protein [candidate division Zixibacteria bacterium]